MPSDPLATLRQKICQVCDGLLAAVRLAGLPDDSLSWLYFADSTTEAFPDGCTIAYRQTAAHGSYRYIIAERGRILRDDRSTSLHRFLYYPLQDITHQAACRHELEHRQPNQDFRRILFAKQLELLAKIHPDYAARRQAEIDTILRQHPYRDDAA
ncbi:hypothetical protein H9Q10_09040 [Eikenella sp. S3360]|uniref:Immunity protein 63 domain-containing protein n=1 Tax=Eikenella glucosivorans TaxID=2766967 RepID=A0ABS0NBY5_9NEIS|nr:Imm63 family immunity protein [Eikenella glucosivorans]MBH5329812.1 hypothetical protein [Eikenella glucosivorans]